MGWRDEPKGWWVGLVVFTLKQSRMTRYKRWGRRPQHAGEDGWETLPGQRFCAHGTNVQGATSRYSFEGKEQAVDAGQGARSAQRWCETARPRGGRKPQMPQMRRASVSALPV